MIFLQIFYIVMVNTIHSYTIQIQAKKRGVRVYILLSLNLHLTSKRFHIMEGRDFE